MTEFVKKLLYFIGSLISIILGLVLIFAKLKKNLNETAASELAKHVNDSALAWSLHGEELKSLKETNRMMLECHSVQLEALDNIAKGNPSNGAIEKQQEKLQKHILDKFAR